MFKKKFFPKYFLLLLSTVTFVACDSGFIELETADVVENEGKEIEEELSIPYYFIAIHNEVYGDNPAGIDSMTSDYLVLKDMVEKASEYNIKLTLMFNPQWVDFLLNDPSRKLLLDQWNDDGHEIGAHHHSVYHGSWNGYTDFSEEDLQEMRPKYVAGIEKYLGDLDDLGTEWERLNSEMLSGCLNDEKDKSVMSDLIVYDTCSGFGNYDEVGKRVGDSDGVKKGLNEFVSTGVVNGITRYWLTHFNISLATDEVLEFFLEVDAAYVYGIITHGKEGQDLPLYEFLELIHELDPEGLKSRTVSEVIEQELLKEKNIDQDLLMEINLDEPVPVKGQENRNGVFDSDPQGSDFSKLCGDGVCNAIEQKNKALCPEDCS